ncbi:extracellular solute-binding protein [Muricomes sp. OA1]|nr:MULTISPECIES: extracellular solute-binding protein [Clostridia]MCH1973138.1 extracellular solute-binding protein [Muricomes sp. OA1]GKH31919.1 multiple sugar-binding protein [Faecalicatena contorta]
MKGRMKKIGALLLTGAMTAGLLAGCGTSQSGKKNNEPSGNGKEFDGVTLSFFVDADVEKGGYQAVIDMAEEKLGLTVEVEEHVGGSDGDNIVKTRLASGEMSDICMYNAGSLLKALNPSEYFYDISNEKFTEKLDDTFKETVTVDGKVYGVPLTSTQAGAIIYYKPDYEELGLEIPKTWDEFLENCEKLEAAGKTAMIGTFGDNWTSQVLFVGDNYNVLAENPDFAEEFEAGTAKYATTDAGIKSFQKLLDVQPYYNEDYLAATYDDGVEMMANGEGTHWAMLTQALTAINALYPEVMDDLGVFAIPGENPEDVGLTVWESTSMYINKNSENLDAILAFMELYLSEEALDTYAEVVPPTGPYCIKDYELPDSAFSAVKNDMQAYFDSGKTRTALEYMTSVKGANCPQICQEVGSGQSTAKEAAAAYDEDCKKQAVQLGLDWED